MWVLKAFLWKGIWHQEGTEDCPGLLRVPEVEDFLHLERGLPRVLPSDFQPHLLQTYFLPGGPSQTSHHREEAAGGPAAAL